MGKEKNARGRNGSALRGEEDAPRWRWAEYAAANIVFWLLVASGDEKNSMKWSVGWWLELGAGRGGKRIETEYDIRAYCGMLYAVPIFSGLPHQLTIPNILLFNPYISNQPLF